MMRILIDKNSTIAAKVDVILTGDKDFLESGITQPLIQTASEFVRAG